MLQTPGANKIKSSVKYYFPLIGIEGNPNLLKQFLNIDIVMEHDYALKCKRLVARVVCFENKVKKGAFWHLY